MRMKWLCDIRRSATWVTAAACVSGVAMSACNAAPQEPMPHAVIAQLKLGTTTMAAAEAALGAAEETELLPDGGQVWVYLFAPEPVPSRPDLPAPRDARRTSEVLRLVFGPTGLLKFHESTRSMLGVRDAAQPSEHEALRDIPLN